MPWELPSARLEAVFFDFDGVILESADLKTEAFRKLFSDHPEHLEAILRHHLENLGVSRFQKFAWIYRELLGAELAEEEAADLGQAFSDLVLEDALRCPPVPGALELLERLDGRLPMFVVSGTPQQELEMLVERRSLGRFFAAIRGTPPDKATNLNALLDDGGFDRRRVLMVGDGLSDHRAALSAGILFVLRETPSQAELCRHLECPRVPDLAQLGRRLAPCLE